MYVYFEYWSVFHHVVVEERAKQFTGNKAYILHTFIKDLHHVLAYQYAGSLKDASLSTYTRYNKSSMQ